MSRPFDKILGDPMETMSRFAHGLLHIHEIEYIHLHIESSVFQKSFSCRYVHPCVQYIHLYIVCICNPRVHVQYVVDVCALVLWFPLR